jgi:WD40 repeat protein
LSHRGDVSVTDVQGMLWSPDGRTLAAFSAGAFNMLSGPAPFPAIDSLWQPGSGYVTPTLVLIDPDTVAVRYSTVISLPTDLPPRLEGGPGWSWEASEFRLLGWTDGGRSLVTMCNLNAASHSGAYTTGQFARIVAYQVWDVQTGWLVKNQTISGSAASPSYRTALYDIALSPDGRTIAYAVRDENPRPGLPFDPGLDMELWDVATGQRKHSVPGLKAEYGLDPDRKWRKMEWSPDSATLYVATKSAVQVIEAATGNIVRQLPDAVPPTSTPTIIPTWIPTTVPQVPPMPPPVSTGGPVVVAPAPAPNIPIPPIVRDIFGALIPKPRAAPAPTIAPDPNYYAPIVGIALSPSGDVLAVHDLRVIRLWDTAGGELKTFSEVPEQVPVYTWSPSTLGGPPPFVAWSPDGRLLSSLLAMGGARVWLIDPDTGKPLKALGKPADAVNWSPYSNLLAIWRQGGVQSGMPVLDIWQAKDAATMEVTPGSNGAP